MITIDVLPNDTLLDIFDFYRIYKVYYFGSRLGWKWDLLVHVCRRWRQIIFGSPLRLQLQLRCTNNTPIRTHLCIWPPLPLLIEYDLFADRDPNHEDNLLAALEGPDRVALLDLRFGDKHSKLVTVLQKPFPMLTELRLKLELVEQLPGGCLGGPMPCLQELHIRYPPLSLSRLLPTLLSSTPGLVTLCLSEIPPTGYISPQTMAICLSTLTRLTSLSIGFQIEDNTFTLPEQIDPAIVAPIVLPSLKFIHFEGICAYMEGLLAQIDCPCLRKIDVSYYYPSLGFQVTQLSNFVNRSEDHQPTLFSRTVVKIVEGEIALHVVPKGPDSFDISLRLQDFEWDVSDLLHVFSKFSQTLSNTHNLRISISANRGPEMGHSEWVQLLCPFTTIKVLYIRGDLAEDAAQFLEDIDVEMASDLLPALEFLCIIKGSSWLPSSSIVKSVDKFCAVRRLSGRPVTFLRNDFEFFKFMHCT